MIVICTELGDGGMHGMQCDVAMKTSFRRGVSMELSGNRVGNEMVEVWYSGTTASKQL